METSGEPLDAHSDRAEGPTFEQFLLVARKVEELEERLRALAVLDVDALRTNVNANTASIGRMKSPRNWLRAGWRRASTRFRG